MSEKEFSDTYAKYFEYKDHTYKGFATTVDAIADSAYASLEIFDTNLDGVADRGIYESYALGYFTEDKHSDNKSYKISRVDAFGLAEKAAKLDDAYSVTGIEIFNEIQEGIKDKDDTDRAWFVEGYTPVAEYDEDGEFTGYKAGYVIYNYDAETGAIKVVKNIDGSDEDSFVKKGVLRAYNINNGTVTIGEDTYHIDNYNELEGNAFKYVKESRFTKTVYTEQLRALFNQFVEYLVVDGELVSIKAVKADKGDELIVVESYAGLSNDGYIVVNGYSTDDLVYDQFRIGSFDGWQKGDYYYYLNDKAAAESFTKGAIYTVASYDETEDVYFVNLAGEFAFLKDDKAYGEYTVYGYETNLIKLTATEDGYVLKQAWDATAKDWKSGSYIKMNSDDKYVIIDSWEPTDAYASVRVYTGKLPADAEIVGEYVKYSDGSADTYVFVNVTSSFRFDKYDAGLVVLLDDRYYSASYNGTNAEEWYLLGAVEYEISTVDLLTGNLDAVKYATNKKYSEGLAYTAQGDVLTLEEGFKVNPASIVAWVGYAYPTETYKAGTLTIAKDSAYYNTKDSANKIAFEKEIFGSANYRGDKISDVIYRVISIDKDGYVEKIDDSVYGNDNAAKLNSYLAKNDIKSVPAFYIYDVDAKKVVIYLVESDATVETTTDEIIDADKFTVVELEDAKIVGQIIYKDTTTTVNGVDTVVRSILGVRYTFEGEAVSGRHAVILDKGYHFGTKGDHLAEQYTVSYNYMFDNKWLEENEVVYGSIVVAEYADCHDADADCDGCELVKSIDVRFKEGDVIKVTFTANGDVKYHDVDAYFICNAIFADDTPVFYAEVFNTVENWGTANEKYVDGVAQNGLFETAGMADFVGNLTGVSPDTIVDGIIDLLD
jgi:hypothetical protein